MTLRTSLLRMLAGTPVAMEDDEDLEEEECEARATVEPNCGWKREGDEERV